MDTYNKNFFIDQSDLSYKSAKEIVPLIIDMFKPLSVVDVGCGIGTWLSVFSENNVKDICGIDGIYVDRSLLKIKNEDFINMDLNNPNNDKFNRKFDVAISMEVAEHIEPTSAKSFINFLTTLSDVVLFSAAIPYQGGTNHLNENWLEYWSLLFDSYDYIAVDIIRKKIWNNRNICWWYRQNTVIFVKKDKLKKYFPNINPNDIGTPNSFIHPELYLWVIARRKLKSSIQYNKDVNYWYLLRNMLFTNSDLNVNINYINTYNIKFGWIRRICDFLIKFK